MYRYLMLSLVLLLSGCVSFSNLPRTTAVPKAPDAILVMGISPAYSVAVKGGDFADGVFDENGGTADANVVPDDGFIVLKLRATSAGTRYSITQVQPDGPLSPAFRTCAGNSIPVFELQGGTVAYAGSFTYTVAGRMIHFAYSQDLAAAKAFLQRNYPQFADQVVAIPVAPAKVASGSCGDQFNVQVHVR